MAERLDEQAKAVENAYGEAINSIKGLLLAQLSGIVDQNPYHTG